MIVANPANGFAQLREVYASSTLSWEEKSLLACLIARFYAAEMPIPIPTLALVLQKPANSILSTVLSLRRQRLAKLQRQLDGEHAVLDFSNPLFSVKAQASAYRLVQRNGVVPSSANLLDFWRETYHKLFNKLPPRDQKDLLRMRHILKHQKENAPQAVIDYLTKHRNLPQKATTLGLFMSYGRAQKV